MSIRVGIVAEIQIVAEGLRHLLSKDTTITVVMLTGSDLTGEAVRSAFPDILLVVATPDHALRLCRELRRPGSRPWIMLLASEEDTDWAVHALREGARGVLSRTANFRDLLKAIHALHKGDIWAPGSTIARAIEAATLRLGLTRERRGRTSFAEVLSHREQEVLQQTASGATNREVAGALRISEATVKAHMARIFQKLGVRDRTQLALLVHQSRTLPQSGTVPPVRHIPDAAPDPPA
jgi:DNA-binding NarL/FixJ family response regulator